MSTPSLVGRRGLLITAAAASLGLISCGGRSSAGGSQAGSAGSSAASDADPRGAGDEDVTPTEDLMREHGLLDRVLLIYEEAMRQRDTPWPAVASGARIVRTFIEGYHEQLEEDHLFPRLEQAGRELQLVATLRQQHQAGRRLTQWIECVASASPTADDRPAVSSAIARFIRMYRPHAAREDTVLFPAFRAVVTRSEYADLGEIFERREHELFGKDGFAGVLAQVAEIEKGLGLDELGKVTPA